MTRMKDRRSAQRSVRFEVLFKTDATDNDGANICRFLIPGTLLLGEDFLRHYDQIVTVNGA